MKDHLGNIRVTVSDKKFNTALTIAATSATSYLPFGMVEPNMFVSASGHRYGHGSHEKDNEISGEGNHLDFGGYGMDPRNGRRWNVEPKIKEFPSFSSYLIFADNPIYCKDPDGKLVLYFNGQHSGSGGKKDYWGGFDQKIAKKTGDYSALYYDGALGGWSNTIGTALIPIIGPILAITSSNLNEKYREQIGYSTGKSQADKIYAMLDKNEKGEITESIKTVEHSMGVAFERGFIRALKEDPRFKTVKFEFHLDIDAFQAKSIPPVANSASKSGGASSVPTTGHTPGSTNANSPNETKNATHSVTDYDTQNVNPSSANNKNPKEDNVPKK